MARRPRPEVPEEVPAAVLERARPPVAVVLGSPGEVARLVAALGGADVTCYQMDLYQAERLRAALEEKGLPGRVVTAPDLWDLPADFQTVLYPAARGSERSLKIDMVEQAFHVLRPRGTVVVWSPYEADQLFPGLLKKVFGRVHAPAAAHETVLWSQREGDRPRRRHEVTFQARVGELPSLRFLSRPGTFSYGRFDEGARALVETMLVEEGDRVLDVGCGCGTNGIFAARRSGPAGRVAFVDSNVRAVALAEHNARANGVTAFEAVASSRVEGLPEGGFDVALANPPYFAQAAVARMFLERARALLRPGGRVYLVTRRPNEVGPLVVEAFGEAEAVPRRGYIVFGAWAHEPGGDHESVFGDLVVGE
jgi:16S rRNA (guanine1207-N2)-methyltransferase